MFTNIKKSFGYEYKHRAALELALYLESNNRLNCAKHQIKTNMTFFQTVSLQWKRQLSLVINTLILLSEKKSQERGKEYLIAISFLIFRTWQNVAGVLDFVFSFVIVHR